MVASTTSLELPGNWNQTSPLSTSLETEYDSYPRIEAAFSLDCYLQREAMLASSRATPNSQVSLPQGFPKHVELPAVWEPSTLNLDAITYRLSADNIKELEVAVKEFNESDKDLDTISPETMRLPNFGSELRELSWRIHEGDGVVIIKGLRPEKYSLRDNAVVFACLCSYIGDQRGRQSAHNDVLTHIYNAQDKAIADPRPGLSNHSLPFHNDNCDILALYVIETAQAGGTTRWSSSGKIYNEMVKTKPHVVDVLARNNWPHETPQKITKNLPLLFLDSQGYPFLSFTRFALTGLPTCPRAPDAPELTPEQADDLDTVQFLASKYAFDVAQEKGDIYIINNRNVLHARDRIQDPVGCSRRHLMRLCLRDTEYGRPIPDDLKRRWGDIFDNNQHKDGKWTLGKVHDISFVSSSKFEASFTNDESAGSHG